MRSRPKAFISHLTISLLAVAGITFACFRVIPVNATTAGFAYLLGVLGTAAASGLAEAIVVSVVSMLCFNFFFFPPVGQFTVADPQNWAALFAFLITAIVASRLSDRVKKQALEAKSRQKETEQLYALSRAILLMESSGPVGFQIVLHIAEIFDCRAVALYDAKSGEVFRGGVEDLPEIESRLKQVVLLGTNTVDAPAHVLLAAIPLGGQPVGALALKGLILSDGALQALLNLVAIVLERVRTTEAASRAEAARQSEEFKSTLLDAIAHDFKTPLTSIKAASTSILSDSVGVSPQFRELTTIIDEETDRLSLLVTEAVRMSQIEAGKIHLERQSVAVDDLLRGVLQHFESRADGRRFQLNAPADLPKIAVDQEMISLALRQLIDNALKYSPPGLPIEIVAGAMNDTLSIRIRDHGPGIPEKERERVFDKFYRGQGVKDQLPGTGLGLYIAREIVRAHGGELTIDADHGAEFVISLPTRVPGHKP